MSMSKFKLEYHAAELAEKNRTAYGLSVLDGHFYTGTVEQLKAIGCINIEDHSLLPKGEGGWL